MALEFYIGYTPVTALVSATAAKIRFLASCHEADNRESAIFDLFHRDVKHRHFATGTEVLVSGIQDALAVPPEIGRDALEEATLYKRERSLVYGVFFLVGRIEADGKPRRLAAPLLHFPAALERQSVGGLEASFLRITANEPTLNFPVLAELLGERDAASSALESLGRRIPSPPLGEDALAEILQVFRELLPRIRVDDLHSFPALLPEGDVRRLGEGAVLACVPAAAMALVENPRSTRGVLFELSRLASSGTVSAPLEAALGSATPPSRSSFPLASIPAVLSRAQKRVLEAAGRHPLTLIVGPPGTGKSYTVTALALEHLARGDSVLVACRTEQALDVVESKLRSMLGETTPVLRGGSTDYTRELKSYLTLLLGGQLEEEEGVPLSERKPRSAASRPRALRVRAPDRETEPAGVRLGCARLRSHVALETTAGKLSEVAVGAGTAPVGAPREPRARGDGSQSTQRESSLTPRGAPASRPSSENTGPSSSASPPPSARARREDRKRSSRS